MNVFDPLSTYSSPLRTAVVFMRATSEPASGSESPNEQRIGASTSGGSHSAFCSSVPARITGAGAEAVRAERGADARAAPVELLADEHAVEGVEAGPPYSVGTCRFIRPSSCAFAITSTGWRMSTSCSAATGRISLAANSRARRAQLLLLVREGERDARDR